MGNGNNAGEIKYIKDNLIEDIDNKSIAYTSGAGSIFKSGIPVGRLDLNNNNLSSNRFQSLNMFLQKLIKKKFCLIHTLALEK